MSKISHVAATAMFAFMAFTQQSEALPEAPVTGLPMVYDANDKLIGPYFSGITYVTIAGQAYALPIQKFRYAAGPVLVLYYSKDGCKGEAYTTTSNPSLGLTPSIYPLDGNIYFATGTPKDVTLKSSIVINAGPASCQPTFLEKQSVFVMTKKPEKFLGITFPIRIDLPK